MTHTISLLVENHQGVISRIAGLFSGRGYNLESITSGSTLAPDISRITLVCEGDDTVIEQIQKQLHKLIDVIKVDDLSDKSTVDRELALIKVQVSAARRAEVIQLAEVFEAKVMDVGRNSMLLELTGSSDKIDDFLLLVEDFPVHEIARSGIVSLERGKKTMKLK